MHDRRLPLYVKSSTRLQVNFMKFVHGGNFEVALGLIKL